MSKLRDRLKQHKDEKRRDIDELLHNINRAANSSSEAVIYMTAASKKSRLERRAVKKALKNAEKSKAEIFAIMEKMLDIVTKMKRKDGEL